MITMSEHVRERRDKLYQPNKELDHRQWGNDPCHLRKEWEIEGYSKVVGIGDISLETNLSYKLVLKNVRHVPDFRLSLFSVDKLDEDGFDIHHGSGAQRRENQFVLCDGLVNAVDESTL